MKTTEMVAKGGDGKVLALYCGECGRVFDIATRGLADQCCLPNACGRCGRNVEKKHWLYCDRCCVERDAEKAREQFANAKKISISEYFKEQPDGLLHVEGYGGGRDGYYDADELHELAEYNNGELPEYFWYCAPDYLTIDARDVIENALEQHFDDAYSHIPAGAEEELKQFLDKWCNGTGIRSWIPSSSIAVVPTGEEREGYRQGFKESLT